MRIDTLLFVFNRPTHTYEVIKSIVEQTKYPDALYIYFDKAEKKEDIEMQDILKEYLQTTKLKNTFYQEQEENKGIKRSIIEAMSNHFEDGADAVIIVEDDIVMHKSCIEYMYTALERYKDSDAINTVCAYRYPVLDFIKNKDENLYGMMIQRFNPWGWATWKHKWKFEPFIDLKATIETNNIILPKGLDEYLSKEEFINGTIGIWSINVVLRQYIMNMYSIYPSKQLVNNIGFDSTGVHSTNTKAFNDEVDWDMKYKIQLNTLSLSRSYETTVNDFLEQHLKEVMCKQNKELQK